MYLYLHEDQDIAPPIVEELIFENEKQEQFEEGYSKEQSILLQLEIDYFQRSEFFYILVQTLNITVQKFKEFISQKLQDFSELKLWSLFYQNNELKNHLELKDYLIINNSILIIRPKYIKISIYYVQKGKKYTLECDLNLSVYDLICILQERTSEREISLYIQQEFLCEKKTLRDYQVRDGYCLQMYVKQYGGGGGKIKNSQLNYQQQQQSIVNESNIIENSKSTNQQSQFSILLNNEIIQITIITKQSSFKLSVIKGLNAKELRDLIQLNQIISKTDLLILNGAILNEKFDSEAPLNLKSFVIYVIPLVLGGSCMKFYIEINALEIKDLSDLKESLNFVSYNIDELFQNVLDYIKSNKTKAKIFQKFKLHQLVAIMLWTGNKIFKKLNEDLGVYKYENWKKYLKCLLDGLKCCDYYRGLCYRGMKNYQNTQIYSKGKIIQFPQILSFSQNQKIAQQFSNKAGMILQAELVSSKNILQLSLVPEEEEVLLVPFTCFKIIDVQISKMQSIIVKMKEIVQPQQLKIILWIDENPENNYIIAKKLEQQNSNLQIIFSLSTEDAIQTLQMYKWFVYSQQSQFKIISDMVRVEQGQMNYQAGIDLLNQLHNKFNYKNEILFFVNDVEQTKSMLDKIQVKNFLITNKLNILERFINKE